MFEQTFVEGKTKTTWTVMLAFMTQIRACYPARQRIYWIQDNLSANWTADIRTFADAHNIELVATPKRA